MDAPERSPDNQETIFSATEGTPNCSVVLIIIAGSKLKLLVVSPGVSQSSRRLAEGCMLSKLNPNEDLT